MQEGVGSRSGSLRLKLPALPELALAACLVGLAVLNAIVASDDKVPGEESPSAWWHWLLVLGPALPVAYRRIAPLRATAVTVVAQIAVWGSGLSSPFFAALVMIYTVCAEGGERGRRLGVGSVVALCAMTTLGVVVAPDVTIDLLVFTSLASALAYMLGTQTAKSRANEVSLAEELAVARVERDVAQERAAAGERQRIARELHDIVGHSLSVIAVRAEAADRVGDKNPDAAVDAVSAIATTARSSLGDVRRVLAGLREEHGDAELAPLPSLVSLPSLIASYGDADLDVRLVGDVPADGAVGAAVGAGVYRIVQEALTNVLKHGGPNAAATVQLALAGAALDVVIEDNGRGAANEPGVGDGLGHTGMRERAEVLGGTLSVGPRAGGGYAVRASIPIDREFASSSKVRSDEE